MEALKRRTIQSWNIIQTKDGHFRYVNRQDRLATIGIKSKETLTKHADKFLFNEHTVRLMRCRYGVLENLHEVPVTYTNPFHDKTNPCSRNTFTCGDYVETYKGFDIYRYNDYEFHAVKNRVCYSMCAGLNGMKTRIDTHDIEGDAAALIARMKS